MKKETLARELQTKEGSPTCLGASVVEDGVNFAVFSSNAEAAYVFIFESANDIEPLAVLPMHRSGDIWHVEVQGIGVGAFYLFQMDGPHDVQQGHRFDDSVLLLDPYARMVTGASAWKAPTKIDSQHQFPKCVVVGSDQFDWQDDRSPNTPLAESIIYEVHLRGFTAHRNSPVSEFKGTYLGFIEMIPYLKKLGVTAVEFLPIMEWYRPTEFTNPVTGAPNDNDWGYDSLSYMAPDEGLATRPLGQIVEFKTLVRELHKAGIEVILDIVVNHSAESDETGPTISFRGLDNKVYYLLTPDNPAQYTNFTGCGNTVNTNHPQVRELLLKVLRTWVDEFHVDGFRFDLCAVLGIDVDTKVKADAPLLTEIANDPVLSKVKLIAEPWAIGAYLMGKFPEPFSEWSDRFRDTVRGFVRAEAGLAAELKAVLSGSTDMFGELGTRLPVNFFTAHDGFSAMDLVSYEQKRNQANGEENRDGSNHNRSWNCGFEGDLAESELADSDRDAIARLRKKQIKNFITLLMLARGVPMILFGDEFGRSNGGNNNTWNQRVLNELDWSLLETNADLHQFVTALIALRKEHHFGGRGQSPQFRPIIWHGVQPEQPDFSAGARFVAWQLDSYAGENDSSFYCAANAYWEPIEVQLPEGQWKVLVNTDQQPGEDIVVFDEAVVVSGSFTVPSRSTIVLQRCTV